MLTFELVQTDKNSIKILINHLYRMFLNIK